MAAFPGDGCRQVSEAVLAGRSYSRSPDELQVLLAHGPRAGMIGSVKRAAAGPGTGPSCSGSIWTMSVFVSFQDGRERPRNENSCELHACPLCNHAVANQSGRVSCTLVGDRIWQWLGREPREDLVQYMTCPPNLGLGGGSSTCHRRFLPLRQAPFCLVLALPGVPATNKRDYEAVPPSFSFAFSSTFSRPRPSPIPFHSRLIASLLASSPYPDLSTLSRSLLSLPSLQPSLSPFPHLLPPPSPSFSAWSR
jgi:hypothetical protein